MTESPKPSRHLKWILPLVVIAVCALAILALKNSKPEAKARVIKEKEWSVSTLTARYERHVPQLKLFGRIESPEAATLTSALQSDVLEVLVKEGDYVSAGQVLVTLDATDAKLVYQQRTADLNSAEAQLNAEKVRYQADKAALKIEQAQLVISERSVERYRALAKKRLASDERAETAESTFKQQQLTVNNRQQAIADHPNRLKQLVAAVERAQALVDAAKLNVSRARIEAPFDGRITQVNTSQGNRISAGASIVSLYNPNTLELRGQVPTKQLNLLQQWLQRYPDQPLIATSEINNSSYSFEMLRLSGQTHSNQSGIDAFFKLPSNLNIEPGRTLSFTLNMPALEQVLAVPSLALYGRDRFYIVSDERLQAITATLHGYSFDDNGNEQLLISSDDIVDGDQIVTTQLPNAITGLKVKVAKP